MVLGFFALGLAGFLLYTGTEPLIKRFSTGEVSFGDRAVVWKGTLSAFRDFPVFGTGLGTFEHVFKLYQPAGLQNIYEHAHNDYLELLLETGIAGVLAAAAFIYVVLWETFRYSSNGKTSYLRAGFICSLLTVAVHSLVDFNLHIPSNAILFFMILGLALASGRASRKTAGKAERGLST
jgi:O-antigen ligase